MKKLFSALAAASLISAPALAQNQPSPVPVTEQQMAIYFTMGAINVCSLNKQKVPVKVAMQASLDEILTTFYNIHGGTVNGKKIEIAQMQEITLANVLLRINDFCIKELPQDDQEKIKKDLSMYQAALQKK